jgi:hypothetical protein
MHLMLEECHYGRNIWHVLTELMKFVVVDGSAGCQCNFVRWPSTRLLPGTAFQKVYLLSPVGCTGNVASCFRLRQKDPGIVPKLQAG